MAKNLTKTLRSWLYANKTVQDLLEKKRIDLSALENAVNNELKGEEQKKWKDMIEEYKLSIEEANKPKDDECNVQIQKEDVTEESGADYSGSYEADMKVYKEKLENLKLVKEAQARNAETIKELEERLKNAKSDAENFISEIKSLESDIAKLESLLVINIVFAKDEEHKKSLPCNFLEISDVSDLYTEELGNVGEMLSKMYMYLPKTISMERTIELVKTVLYIRNGAAQEKKIKFHAPEEIWNSIVVSEVFKDCNGIERIVL